MWGSHGDFSSWPEVQSPLWPAVVFGFLSYNIAGVWELSLGVRLGDTAQLPASLLTS